MGVKKEIKRLIADLDKGRAEGGIYTYGQVQFRLRSILDELEADKQRIADGRALGFVQPDDPELSVDEIRQATERLQHELDKDEPVYGVTYDSDLATVLATAKQWLADQEAPAETALNAEVVWNVRWRKQAEAEKDVAIASAEKAEAALARVREYGEKMLAANGMSWCSMHGRSVLDLIDNTNSIVHPEPTDETRIEYGWRSRATGEVHPLPLGPIPNWWHSTPRKRWDPMYRMVTDRSVVTSWMPVSPEPTEEASRG